MTIQIEADPPHTGQSPHPTFFQSLKKTVYDEEVDQDQAEPTSLRLYVELVPGECQVLANSLKTIFARFSSQLIIGILKYAALKPDLETLLDVSQQLETAASAGDPFAFSQLLRLVVEETRSSATEWEIERILCIVVMPDASKADQQCIADVLTVLLRILQPDPVDELIAQQMPGASASSAESEVKRPQPRGQLMLIASSPSWSDWQLDFPYDVLRIMEIDPMQTPNTKHLLEELIKEVRAPSGLWLPFGSLTSTACSDARAKVVHQSRARSTGFIRLAAARASRAHLLRVGRQRRSTFTIDSAAAAKLLYNGSVLRLLSAASPGSLGGTGSQQRQLDIELLVCGAPPTRSGCQCDPGADARFYA